MRVNVMSCLASLRHAASARCCWPGCLNCRRPSRGWSPRSRAAPVIGPDAIAATAPAAVLVAGRIRPWHQRRRRRSESGLGNGCRTMPSGNAPSRTAATAVLPSLKLYSSAPRPVVHEARSRIHASGAVAHARSVRPSLYCRKFVVSSTPAAAALRLACNRLRRPQVRRIAAKLVQAAARGPADQCNPHHHQWIHASATRTEWPRVSPDARIGSVAPGAAAESGNIGTRSS